LIAVEDGSTFGTTGLTGSSLVIITSGFGLGVDGTAAFGFKKSKKFEPATGGVEIADVGFVGTAVFATPDFLVPT
jgi:hypothetical protein